MLTEVMEYYGISKNLRPVTSRPTTIARSARTSVRRLMPVG